MNTRPLTDEELHGYVDERLAPEALAALAERLKEDAEAATRVSAYRAQNEALRGLFDPVLDEPLPASLVKMAVRAPSTADSAGWPWQRLAAGVLIAVLGGAGGWFAHARYQPSPQLAQAASLPRQAAVAHAVFSPDVRRPVEVTAEHEEQLITWLSKRLGAPVRVPHLGKQGFELIGGRLLPGNAGPVAQFMYQDGSGQRLTLYVTTDNPGHRDTAFRFAQEGPLNVFYWIDGKFGYALSASIAKNELANVAAAVYEQLEAR